MVITQKLRGYISLVDDIYLFEVFITRYSGVYLAQLPELWRAIYLMMLYRFVQATVCYFEYVT